MRRSLRAYMNTRNGIRAGSMRAWRRARVPGGRVAPLRAAARARAAGATPPRARQRRWTRAIAGYNFYNSTGALALY